jgi:hypothetical protein
MSFNELLAENRRLVILRALNEAAFAANETVLKQVTERFGHTPTRELIRADLTFLDEHGLIRLEKIDAQSGQLWIAHLRTAGQEVAEGRVHPGVARREPD